MRILPCLTGMTLASFLLAGTAIADDKSTMGANSGFLGNAYSSLQELESPYGLKTLRFRPAIIAAAKDAAVRIS